MYCWHMAWKLRHREGKSALLAGLKVDHQPVLAGFTVPKQFPYDGHAGSGDCTVDEAVLAAQRLGD